MAVLSILGSPAIAGDCSARQTFASTETYLEPLSVPLSDLQNHLNASKWSDGVIVEIAMKDRELWLDIVDFPGTTTAAAAVRIVFQIGRLSEDGFDKVVLSDAGQGLFSISEPILRDIGCQFIWGREGGQNPIALMREFFKNLKSHPDGAPVSTAFNGSLLGDTTLATKLHNDVLIPKWVLSAVN